MHKKSYSRLHEKENENGGLYLSLRVWSICSHIDKFVTGCKADKNKTVQEIWRGKFHLEDGDIVWAAPKKRQKTDKERVMELSYGV